MRIRIALALVAVLVLSLAGVATASQAAGALVTVVHGIPGVTVDVYVNDELTLPNFEPDTVTDPLPLPAGIYRIDIRAAGDPPDAEPLISGEAEVTEGLDASIVAHLTEDGDPTLSVFVNDVSPTAAGEGRLTARHTAAAPTVDVRADGAVLFTLSNGEEGVADVPAGIYAADIVPTGTDDPVLGPIDVEIPEGTNVIAYAVGSLADDTLRVLVQVIDGLGEEKPGETRREADRIGGADRFETAVLISQYQFPEGAPEVYLARSDVPFDALAGGTLTDGPILLVPSCGTVPGVVLDEIQRVDPDRVVALGGPKAICEDVLEQAANA